MKAAMLGCVVLLSACASIPQNGAVHLAPNDEAWRDVLRDNTRRDQPYHYTIRECDLRATLVTPRLRKAFLASRASLHGRFAKEIETELVSLGNPDEGVDAPQKAKPDAEEQVVLFVAFYAADQKERDLSAGYSIWDTRLVRGSGSAKPVKIELIKMSPAVTDMFPYIDRFDDFYVMRFPLADAQGHPFLTPGGEPLRLEVKSAEADAVVEWSLAE